MLTRRALVSTGLAAPLALLASPALPQERGWRWRTGAAVPWPVQEVYGAARAGQVAIAGGMQVAGGVVRPIDRVGYYDPKADRWEEGPPLPEPRHHPAVAAVGDRLYAIGGFIDGPCGAWRQRVDVFVEEGRRWTRAAPLPEPQSEAVAIVHAGLIHLISGRTSRTPDASRWDEQRDVDVHRVFDPGSGRWSLARPIPGERNSAAGALIDGKLYVVGGRTMAGGNLAHLDRYDPDGDRWERLRPMPRPAGGLAAAALDDRLIAFGGEVLGRGDGPEGVIADCWLYDPKPDRWQKLPDMPTPRHGLAAAALGGRVVTIGGGALPGIGRTTDLVEVLEPLG